MNDVLRQLSPNPSDWFADEVEYQGWGRAELDDPKGAVEGPARVDVTEAGDITVSLIIQQYEYEHHLPSSAGPLPLLFRKRGDQLAEPLHFQLGQDWPDNPCSSLTVTTHQGTFSSEVGIPYDFSMRIQPDLGLVITLTFPLLGGEYKPMHSPTPEYWAMPLTNFISEFVQPGSELDDHPLRIFPTPTIPAGLSEEETVLASGIANQRNHLILFHYAGAPAFIERTEDYDAAKSLLSTGKKTAAITAVMVGKLDRREVDVIRDGWHPADLLPFLGLATGREVGSAWVEFRSSDGSLVLRQHGHYGASRFADGRPAIKEHVHRGTGALLDAALSSPHFGKSRLRVTVRHVVRAGLDGLSIEDKFVHLARALDGLCKEFKFARATPLGDVIGAEASAKVKTAVRTTSKEIRALAREYQESQPERARRIEVLAQRVAASATVTPGFDKQLIQLLEKFELLDAIIMDQYLIAHPWPSATTTSWAALVARVRGTIMHEGFLDFSPGAYDIMPVVSLTQHLHDILLRIVFKMIGYHGTYQPVVQTMPVDSPVSWVTSATTAVDLGYRG